MEKPKLTPAYTNYVVGELPQELATLIGHIITRAAYLDHVLQVMAYNAIGLPHDLCRIAIKDPRRGEEKITLVQDILLARGMTVYPELQAMKAPLSKHDVVRDRFAHGIFAVHPETGEIGIRITKGYWNLGERTDRPSKREIPQGLPVTVQDLQEVRREQEVLIENAKLLNDWIHAAAAALAEKLPGRDQQGRPPSQSK